MDVGSFNVETAVIGGMSLISVHMVIMSQIRKFIPEYPFLNKIFDLFNYPVAFILILVLNPPWPIVSAAAWGEYISYSVALAVLASITAGKTIQEDKRKLHEMEVETALQQEPPDDVRYGGIQQMKTKE
jgi:hypothetical protein